MIVKIFFVKEKCYVIKSLLRTKLMANLVKELEIN